MKIGPEGADSFHMDGGTDGQRDRRDGANSHFIQFCESA